MNTETESASAKGGGLFRFEVPRVGVLAFALCALTLLLLAPALGGDYLWDDTILVRDNSLVRGFQHWSEWFSRSLFETHEVASRGTRGGTQYYRPLVLFSFALDYALGGTNPAIGHVSNLLFYAGCVLAVYATLRRWQVGTIAPLLGATWFALHPTHVECAAWISGRTDLLALLGILLASYAAARRFAGKHRYIALELLGTLIAYGSKEIAIVLPVFYAAEAWVSLQRPTLDRNAAQCVLWRAAPQLLLACLYLAARQHWLPFHTGLDAAEPAFSLATRTGMVLETLGRAVTLSLWPWPSLGQHGLISVAANGQLGLSRAYVGVGAVTIAILIGLGFALRRRQPAVLLALLLAACCFLPTSNLSLSRLQCLLFERYLFIPHVGVAWVLAIAADPTHTSQPASSAERHPIARWLRTATWSFAPVWVVAFAVLTQLRATDYSDTARFWKHELSHNPLSAVAPSSLAELSENQKAPRRALPLLSLCYQNATKRGQFSEADQCLFRTLTLVNQRTLDAQTATLQSLAMELRLVLDGKSDTQKRPAIETPVGRFQLSLPAPRAKQFVAANPGVMQAEIAIIESRLGNHLSAVESANESLSLCADCAWVAPLALVYAAADDYVSARRLLAHVRERLGENAIAPYEEQVVESERLKSTEPALSGPALIHAKAQRLLSLGRFGLAYAVLLPEKEHFLPVAPVAIDFAKIAYFAGHDDTARAVLSLHLTPQQVDETLRTWGNDQPMLR